MRPRLGLSLVRLCTDARFHSVMVTEWLSRVYGVEEVDVSRKAVAAGLLAILSVNIVIGCYIAYAVFVAGCAEKCGWYDR